MSYFSWKLEPWNKKGFQDKTLIDNVWNVYFTFISCYWSKVLGQVSWQWKMGVSCALQPLLTAVYSCIFALKKRHYFANKCPSSQGCGFSSSRVWTWALDHKESWVLKNWCFWTVVLEKTLESPLDCKEIKPVHPKGNQSWVFIGRTDVEAETPTLWLPHVKSWLTVKDPDAGRDWGREEKGTTEDEMARWHHWLDGRESKWTLRVGDGQAGLACCDSWGRKESDTTEQLNWTEPCHATLSAPFLQ